MIGSMTGILWGVDPLRWTTFAVKCKIRSPSSLQKKSGSTVPKYPHCQILPYVCLHHQIPEGQYAEGVS